MGCVAGSPVQLCRAWHTSLLKGRTALLQKRGMEGTANGVKQGEKNQLAVRTGRLSSSAFARKR